MSRPLLPLLPLPPPPPLLWLPQRLLPPMPPPAPNDYIISPCAPGVPPAGIRAHGLLPDTGWGLQPTHAPNTTRTGRLPAATNLLRRRLSTALCESALRTASDCLPRPTASRESLLLRIILATSCNHGQSSAYRHRRQLLAA